ncbi:MAG: bifunctional glutamate N-acetyltransferase/amino-acid acetyltransferase ArgJ [Atopobiaceae bacterium]|nr:bifunctional glutamate N-acetyltransferase/amino-acid acetyltransferase ArgJ [Atopobiaceae bacterium]
MKDYRPLELPTQNHGQRDYGIVSCEGGICAAKGVRAAGVCAGLRKEPGRLDLSLVALNETSVCAGVFTQNRFCAAPVQVSQERVENGRACAIVLNSGNANASTGAPGVQVAQQTTALVAEELGCAEEEVLVASTGVIGVPLALDGFVSGIPQAVRALDDTPEAAHRAARAVMTTDTVAKESSCEVELPCPNGGSVRAHVGGFVKGSGMIMPNMATMLCVLSTDAPLTSEAAHDALLSAVGETFNKVTVDSDTSTNDTCVLFATGDAGGDPVGVDSLAYPAIAAAIRWVCEELARKIAADGEGATKLVTVDVLGAANDEDAETVARSIANSPLVKTAIFGHDANWGRVAMAAGKCGVDFDQYNVDIDLLGVPVLRAGLPLPMDEEDLLRRFEEDEIRIAISLGEGEANARVWTCDLTHEYVTINGDYRT